MHYDLSMKIHRYREFPNQSLRDQIDASRKQLPPGLHLVSVLGARYFATQKRGLRYVAYLRSLTDNEYYLLLVTLREEFTRLDGLIRRASPGSIFDLRLIKPGPASLVQPSGANLVWGNWRAPDDTVADPWEYLSNPRSSAFRQIVAAIALNRPPASPIRVPLAWECGTNPLRIMVVGQHPPLSIHENDLPDNPCLQSSEQERVTAVLGNLAAWMKQTAKHRGGHILDAAYPNPTEIRRKGCGVELADSLTGLPAVYRFLHMIQSVGLEPTGEITPSIFHLFLSPVPSLQGERAAVGSDLAPNDFSQSFHLFFNLVQPDVVILSGRLVVRKVGRLLRGLIRPAPFALSAFRKGVDPDGNAWGLSPFRTVLQSFHNGSNSVFVAAPDLRFFRSPKVQRTPVPDGYWQTLEKVIAIATRKKPNCDVPSAHCDPSQPGIGSLTVTTVPPGADVEIVGVGTFPSPLYRDKLNAGDYQVKIRKQGFEDVSFTAQIRAYQTCHYHRELILGGGNLVVESSPTGVCFELHVRTSNGRAVASEITPHTFAGMRTGSYFIRFPEPAGGAVTSVEVKANSTTTIRYVINNAATGTSAPVLVNQPKLTPRPYTKGGEKFLTGQGSITQTASSTHNTGNTTKESVPHVPTAPAESLTV